MSITLASHLQQYYTHTDAFAASPERAREVPLQWQIQVGYGGDDRLSNLRWRARMQLDRVHPRN